METTDSDVKNKLKWYNHIVSSLTKTNLINEMAQFTNIQPQIYWFFFHLQCKQLQRTNHYFNTRKVLSFLPLSFDTLTSNCFNSKNSTICTVARDNIINDHYLSSCFKTYLFITPAAGSQVFLGLLWTGLQVSLTKTPVNKGCMSKNCL